MSSQVFSIEGNTRVIAASTTTATVAIPTIPAGGTLMISNKTAGWAHIVFGTTAVVPVPGTDQPGFPVPPQSVIIVTPPFGATNIAAILETGSGNIAFTPGVGD